MEQLSQASTKAFQESEQLSIQAAAAAQAGGIASQAANTVHVANLSAQRSVDDARINRAMGDNFSKLPDFQKELKEALKESFLGVPLWAWIGGGLLLVLLVSTAPAMAQGYVMRRALED